MIEVAIRINQLLTSNVNCLVDSVTSPEKILKLLITDLEEAIISLNRDAGRAERAARERATAAGRHEAAALDWAEKARFAMDKKREDLARGALVERDRAAQAARDGHEAASLTESEAASFRETIGSLESKLAEARTKLGEVRNAAAAGVTHRSGPDAANPAARTDRIMDRVETLEKRFEFAQAAKPAAPGKSIDEELSEMARDARLEAELAEMRKASKKGH